MIEPKLPGAASSAGAAALAALRAATQVEQPDAELEPFLTYAWAIVRGELRDAAFVEAARPAIAAARLALVDYLLALDAYVTSTFWDDEWRRACTRRSKLEAARMLWAQELGGPGAPDIDCEVVDDLLRQKGRHEGGLRPDQIPPGTPTSHWWWWYPAPPPG